MGKSALTVILLFLFSAGSRAAQPVMLANAAGDWNGRVLSSGVRYEVSVLLQKESAFLKGFYSATGPGRKGAGFSGEFSALNGDGACYKVKVKVLAKPQVEYDASACPAGLETLRITSAMGRGTLVFSDKFRRCEVNLSGMSGNLSGVLYRVKNEKTDGSKRDNGIQGLSMPPLKARKN